MAVLHSVRIVATANRNSLIGAAKTPTMWVPWHEIIGITTDERKDKYGEREREEEMPFSWNQQISWISLLCQDVCLAFVSTMSTWLRAFRTHATSMQPRSSHLTSTEWWWFLIFPIWKDPRENSNIVKSWNYAKKCNAWPGRQWIPQRRWNLRMFWCALITRNSCPCTKCASMWF